MLKNSVHHLKQLSSKSTEDLFTDKDFNVKHLCGKNNKMFLLLESNKNDTRRNTDPLLFSGDANQCFCDFQKHWPNKIFGISKFSNLLIAEKKGNLFSTECGPEPCIEIYKDIFKICHRAKGGSLIFTVNLHGSGASIPQHFHVQIHPLAYKINGEEKRNSIQTLLNNFEYATDWTPVNESENIKMKEIIFPLWGIVIAFPEEYLPEQIGAKIFNVFHREIRYRSQLKLSYNLYMLSENPHVVSVLFRESYKEVPFVMPDILALISQVRDQKTATGIKRSGNIKWRWGWLEAIGGLPVRDYSFENTHVYNFDFWEKVYEKVSLEKKYRRMVKQQLTQGLVLATSRI